MNGRVDEDVLSAAEAPRLTLLEIKQAALYQSLSLARDCWRQMERFDSRGVPGIKYLLEKCSREGHLRAAKEQARELRAMGPGSIDHVLADMLAFEGLA
jgi:hypothetical protein